MLSDAFTIEEEIASESVTQRRRSEGPLTTEQLGGYGSTGIELAYDTTAYGWVPANCIDDVSPSPPVAEVLGDQQEVIASVEVQFVTESARLVDQWRASRIDQRQFSESLWRLCSSLSLDSEQHAREVKLAQLCTLQQRAADVLRDHGFTQRGELTISSEVATRYSFRPWLEDDLERFIFLLDDERMWEHLNEPYPDPLTIEHAQKLIKLSRQLDSHEVRAVVCDGEIVGQVRLQFANSKVSPGIEAHDAEISYWLGRPYWGKGMMSEIVGLFTQMSLRRTLLKSLSAWVKESNSASIRVLEKCGYRYLGRKASEESAGPGKLVYRAYAADFLS